MGLTECCEDGLLFGGSLEIRLLHTTHVETRVFGETLVEHLTMPTSVTENEELSRPRRSLFNELHKHVIPLSVLHNLRNHIGHGDFSISHGGWWISVIETFIGHGENLHLFLILPLNREERWTDEPMKHLRETILPLRRRRETKDVFGAHFEEGLTEHLGTYVVGFINDESSHRIKITERVLFEGERLKHSYHKVTICLLLVLLNYTYRGTWTELLNSFPPLIR